MNPKTKNEIIAQEYPADLDEIRKQMVCVAYFKYGPARKNFGEGRVDALESAHKCMKKYVKTKNKEYLLDAMNYLGFEFKWPSLLNAYYAPTDSDGSAGTAGTPINMER